jgi:hypothetical protein
MPRQGLRQTCPAKHAKQSQGIDHNTCGGSRHTLLIPILRRQEHGRTAAEGRSFVKDIMHIAFVDQ